MPEKERNPVISDDDFPEEELDMIYGIDRNGVPGEDTCKNGNTERKCTG